MPDDVGGVAMARESTTATTPARSSEEVRRRIEATSKERGPKLDGDVFHERRGSVPSSRSMPAPLNEKRKLSSKHPLSLSMTESHRVSRMWGRQRFVSDILLVQLLLSFMLFALALGFQWLPAPFPTWSQRAVAWLLTESIDPQESFRHVQRLPALGAVTDRLSPWITVLSPETSIMLTRPVRGRLIRGYGEIVQSGQRVLHQGVDISAVPGDSVRTIEAGTVLKVGFEGTTYGLFVLVQHDGWQGMYANLESVLVQEGDVLRAAAIMGTAGGAGESNGEWIHVEAYREGDPVDPIPYLRPYRER